MKREFELRGLLRQKQAKIVLKSEILLIGSKRIGAGNMK
ncbi:MAG: hypothetical protein ACI97A_000866 [Planctomycetota bacterium]|jgi:hypothetical protein